MAAVFEKSLKILARVSSLMQNADSGLIIKKPGPTSASHPAAFILIACFAATGETMCRWSDSVCRPD